MNHGTQPPHQDPAQPSRPQGTRAGDAPMDDMERTEFLNMDALMNHTPPLAANAEDKTELFTLPREAVGGPGAHAVPDHGMDDALPASEQTQPYPGPDGYVATRQTPPAPATPISQPSASPALATPQAGQGVPAPSASPAGAVTHQPSQAAPKLHPKQAPNRPAFDTMPPPPTASKGAGLQGAKDAGASLKAAASSTWAALTNFVASSASGEPPSATSGATPGATPGVQGANSQGFGAGQGASPAGRPGRSNVITIRGPVDEFLVKTQLTSRSSRWPARFAAPSSVQWLIMFIVGLVCTGQMATRMAAVVETYRPLEAFVPQYQLFSATAFITGGAITAMIGVLLVWMLTGMRHVLQYIVGIAMLFIVFPTIAYGTRTNVFMSVRIPGFNEMFNPAQWPGGGWYVAITGALVVALVLATIDRIMLLFK